MDGKDSLCKVCGDKASGKHYGVASCDGCRGFFKRSIRRNLDYVCKESGRCVVDVTRRNQCQSCRFRKCLQVNMKKDAVQHERAPRCLSGGGAVSSGGGAPPPLAAVPLLYPPPPLPLSLSLHRPHFVPSPIPSLGVAALCGSRGCYGGMVEACKEDEVSSSQESTARDAGGGTAGRRRSLAGEEGLDSATKLLSLSLSCVRAIPSFQQLPDQDQKVLLENSWKDLFVLTAAQWSLHVDEESLVGGCEESGRAEARREAGHLVRVLARLAHLRLDHTEFACLKALVLFKPETVGRLEVEMLQEQTQAMLRGYCGSQRLGRLLLGLLAVCSVSQRTLLKLFFPSADPGTILDHCS